MYGSIVTSLLAPGPRLSLVFSTAALTPSNALNTLSLQLKLNDAEIAGLSDQLRNARIDLGTAESQVTHMTEQLIQYDLAMKNSTASCKAKEAEVEEVSARS